MMVDKVYSKKMVFTNKESLIKSIIRAWQEIKKEKIQCMIENWYGRLDKILECRGEQIN